MFLQKRWKKISDIFYRLSSIFDNFVLRFPRVFNNLESLYSWKKYEICLFFFLNCIVKCLVNFSFFSFFWKHKSKSFSIEINNIYSTHTNALYMLQVGELHVGKSVKQKSTSLLAFHFAIAELFNGYFCI